MKFPKRGESSRKRKRQLYDRIYKKIAKLIEGINDLKTRNDEATCSFSLYSNKLWVRNTSCLCQNCFGTSFKPETACDGWQNG